MKTAKSFPTDIMSSRRAQPVRQTRTNPPRTSGLLSRSLGSRDAFGGGLNSGHNDEQQTEIFPAITHFADAITALPKEVARHFTLLKEVDAKIFAPEETLGQLVEAALNCPLPERRQNLETSQITAPTSIQASAPVSINGSVVNGQNNSTASVTHAVDVFDPTNTAWNSEDIQRRTLFRHCAYTMQEMLVSLDEKNHVISTATEALNKQLARLDDCFPYIENEISEEARYGSLTHWAYVENRSNKSNEKSRRDIGSVNHLTNAAGADEAAARSEARKQAMLAKKGRSHHVESDFDDHLDSRHKGDLGKKSHGNSKKGRPAEINVGLGITNGADLNGTQPSKRRKVEKGPNTGILMERSMSGVYGSNGSAPKGKLNSPRETPVPDGSKKKAKGSILPNGQPKKRTVATNSNAMSPSLASSPMHTTFSESKAGSRSSPAPTNGGRPTTSRARQNSTQSVLDSAKQRPSSSASNKANGSTAGPADLSSVAGITGRSIPDVKVTMKESGSNLKGDHLIEDADQDDPDMRGALLVGSRKDDLKREDTEGNGDVMQGIQPTNTTVVTTKSGRASKPSTPAIPSFPEPVRSRSGRNVLEQTGNAKRSHKKGASQAAHLVALAADDDASSSMLGDEEDAEVDADEPTYCYCNGVSYGEMVACDAEGCAKEWFHLDCVGLKVAPKGNAKWYCDDCKENMKNSKRFNGR